MTRGVNSDDDDQQIQPATFRADTCSRLRSYVPYFTQTVSEPLEVARRIDSFVGGPSPSELGGADDGGTKVRNDKKFFRHPRFRVCHLSDSDRLSAVWKWLETPAREDGGWGLNESDVSPLATIF